ncbi:MAG: metallophosphoesterase [Pseudorhodoplanes sp.]|jgi:3',5'-cyclic AMP phosphodiesterase CpdA|nr:metallophosphoesterase [Pseudorhodoplanes sp.]
MYVLAHLSDPHLAPMPQPQLPELLSKRAIGFLNWRRNRHKVHRIDVLARILHDLQDQMPDHIALTGDLVNIALPAEFSVARVFLDHLGKPEDVSFVPGNHDFYVRQAAQYFGAHWGEFMRGDRGAPGEFPYLRRRGPLALIGVSSAIPTLPFMATGEVGPEQLEALSELLLTLQREKLFRVVMIHHPPESKPNHRFKRLIDADAFRAVLKKRGADLVLHGHDHVHSVVMLEGPRGRIPAVGVPSASCFGGESDPAAYNLYRIEQAKDGWRCEAITRGFRVNAEGPVVELARRMIVGA